MGSNPQHYCRVSRVRINLTRMDLRSQIWTPMKFRGEIQQVGQKRWEYAARSIDGVVKWISVLWSGMATPGRKWKFQMQNFILICIGVLKTIKARTSKTPGAAIWSHTMYQFNDSKNSTPPQNHQLIVLISESKVNLLQMLPPGKSICGRLT